MEEATEHCGWENLDVELFSHILSTQSLQPWEWTNIFLTCKKWNATLAHNNSEFSLWQPLFQSHFGGEKKDSISWRQHYLESLRAFSSFDDVVTQIHRGLVFGHLALVERVLGTQEDPNKVLDFLRTYAAANPFLEEIVEEGTEESLAWTLNALSTNPSRQINKNTVYLALEAACRLGKVGMVRILLACGVDVASVVWGDLFGWETEDPKEWKETPGDISPLGHACNIGNLELVHMLLDSGMPVSGNEGIKGMSPLWVASWRGHLDLVRMLILHGADPNDWCLGGFSWSIAFTSGHHHILQYFLDGVQEVEDGQDDICWTINMEKCSWKGLSALDDACKKGNVEFIRFLLDHGLDINKVSEEQTKPRYLPLNLAVESALDEDFHLVKFLVEEAGADVNGMDREGLAPLHIVAAGLYRPHLMEYLLGKGADINATALSVQKAQGPLAVSAQLGRLDSVRWLINHGASLVDSEGFHIMCYASSYRQANVIQMLIDEFGLDPKEHPLVWDVLDSSRCEFHKWNCSWLEEQSVDQTVSSEDMIAFLLNLGLNPNTESEEGETPLLWLAKKLHHYAESDMVRVFIRFGASCTVRGTNESTLLHIAVQRNSKNLLLDFLDGRTESESASTRECENDLPIKARKIANEDTARERQGEKVSVHAKDNQGRTALHFVQNGIFVDILVEHGAMVNVVDDHGKTPLFHACELGHRTAVLALLKHGADPNVYPPTKPTWSPLAAAARRGNGQTKLVEALLGHGANPHVGGPNDSNISFILSEGLFLSYPLAMACKARNNDILEALLKAGEKGSGEFCVWIEPFTSRWIFTTLLKYFPELKASQLKLLGFPSFNETKNDV